MFCITSLKQFTLSLNEARNLSKKGVMQAVECYHWKIVMGQMLFNLIVHFPRL